MARLARVVAPGLPHHVTQRGNRRQRTFFSDDDYATYKALLAEHCAATGVAMLVHRLMPNLVHLILVPPEPDALRAALGEVHRRYTRHVNFRAGCPYDNAMAESFMKTLKQEEVDAGAYRDMAHATAAIGAFIEEVSNRQRLHSALAYLSPVEFEAVQPAACQAVRHGLLEASTSCPPFS
jgi:REP element-mobilizing transposase RayT